MVFYRKYRPQKIEELDNDLVRESLYSIFSKESFVHAFLFTGPKGLGKTSTARIIAKVINCEKHKDLKGLRGEKEIEPDNKCSQCLSITNGTNLDVLEIDGASNRGIDEIRDLKEKINLAPFKAKRKIYIIDEVHMLTTEAFNALLKTLEEPPSHAVFILCTTEAQKVPPTITSRCFRVNFTRATNDELVRSFQRIVKAEGIKIDKEGLFEIAKLSDGSFRDGAKILEEVSIFAGKKIITKDMVNEKFNTLGMGESVNQMLEALAARDIKKGFRISQDLAKQGADFKFFIQETIDSLHQMLLREVGVEKKEKEQQFSINEIKKLFELLTSAYQETKYAVIEQVPLELVVLEWANQKDTKINEEPIVKDEDSPKEVKTPSQSSFWLKFIDEVKGENHLIAGVLRSCIGKEVTNGKLDILANSNFHKEKLEEVKTMKLLEESARKLVGKEVKISIHIKGGER